MNRKLKLEELNRVNVEEFIQQQKIPVSIILDNIRSLNNIGSIFRTADAFNVKQIYLCGITAKPPHRDITKTALGATNSVKWSYFESVSELITKLKSDGEIIISIEQTENSVSLEKFNFNQDKNYTFIVGNEVDGVQQNAIDKSDYTVEIPQFGTKHSLNVSNCTSIILWEALKNFI